MATVRPLSNHHYPPPIYKDDSALIRLLVGRSEIDLDDVKKIFKDTYKKSLSAWVESECSGNYKKILLLLIGDA